MSKPATLSEAAAAIVDLLVDGCAWNEEELLVALAGRGVDLGVDPEDTLAEVLESDDLPLVVAVDDGYVSLSALLRGRTLTHRLTAVEVEHDIVVLGTDLAPLWFLTDAEEYHRLVDGTDLVQAVRGLDDDLLAERCAPADLADDFVSLLPVGTFQRLGLTAGDLLGVTVREEGFEFSSVVDVQDPHRLGERLAQCLGQHGVGEPDEVSDLLWQACVEDPDLLVQPVAPLRDALEAAGLAWEGDLVGPRGFGFERWRTEKRVARLASVHRLDEDGALAVLALTRMYEELALVLDAVQGVADTDRIFEEIFGEGDGVGSGPALSPGARVVRGMVEFLDDPSVAEAVLVETIGAGRAGAAALGLFAETLEEQVPRRHGASLRWLRGKALERMGRVLEAEEAFEAALDLDGAHLLALYELSRYASDRGNAERGRSLLRRAGAPAEDGLVELLTRFRPQERTDIGRNEPCWCGSGRKYKVCHRNCESLPLADHAAWLYQKAGTYLSDGPWRDRAIDVAEIRAHHWNDDGAVWRALNEGLVTDLVLFEGGAFEEFVAERGVLLPDDERLLADQWLLAQRSVHEIESVSPGEGFTARDIRTGDRVEVREGTASRSLKADELICARLVPAGDTIQIFGALEKVTLRERDDLIALLDASPDPEELAALLSARYAPPQLENTEGEPMVMCEATLRSEDPVALAGLLDKAYDAVVGEAGQWVEHVTTHGMERIRATLEVDGPDLKVEVNSEARMDRVLAKVRKLQPGLLLLAETRRPAADVHEAISRAPFSGSGSALDPADPADPAVAAVLAEFIRAQEQAWLDEPIPALAGATPREAAADPTRRPDLLRLLDTYDEPTGAGIVTMDPARLRAALGLG
ncbi:MAG: SEC-C domain-containing protein [Actinomycetota bacterium]|nr:SEC-C domain-containing protein [Actinomycetota bacterium]